MTDYATYNESILGNTSVIAYDITRPYIHDKSTEHTVIRNLSQRFQVVGLDPSQLNQTVERHKIDHFYSLRAGYIEPLPDNCPTSVHVVFKYCFPHGDTYAYISEWLARGANEHFNSNFEFVPHIVNLPSQNACLRSDWSIPPHAKVIGRHGGAGTFDIDWVKPVIERVLTYRSDYWFVFLNTNKWIDHPRVLFLDPVHDLQQKANYIASCDVMIHAREDGESFGCAIAEFLFFDKPVLSWSGGYDQNHTEMMRYSPLLYDNPTDLELKLNSFYVANYNWKSRVQEFSPERVMHKFNQVFLK